MIDMLMGLLLFGAVSNNIQHNGMWIDLRIIIVSYIIFFILLLKTRRAIYSQNIRIEGKYFIRSIALITIFISLSQYLNEGIPLLSADPDIARMEFMTSSLASKVLANFIPFIITYYFSFICISWKTVSQNDIFIFIFCILLFILNGHKASIIIVALHCLLGWVAIGKKINAKKIIYAMLMSLPLISFIFFYVAGLDNYFDGFLLFVERLTGIAEFGLFAAVDELSNSLVPSDVFINIQYLYLKIFGSYTGYSPSFGRLITATYYRSSIDASLWELTPTMFADFFTLGGWVGVVAGTVLYALLLNYVANSIGKATSLYLRCFWVVIFFHLFLNIMLGSLASRVLVILIPFIIFWLCGLFIRVFMTAMKIGLCKANFLHRTYTVDR